MFDYLAAPHTHPNRLVRTMRYIIITHVASRLVLEGRRIYSPISMSHHMDMMQNNNISHDQWLELDIQLFRHAGCVLLLELEGHNESKGMNNERDWAMRLRIPMEPVDPTVYANPDHLAIHRALLQDDITQLSIDRRDMVYHLEHFDKQLSSW